VLTEAILSKGLTQSKTLDCGGSGESVLYRNARAPQLNRPSNCKAAELVLLPEQKL